VEVEWLLTPEEELPLENIAGRVLRSENLRATATALHEARLYVGNDTGVSHLAAAAGAPSVVVFGPTNPAVWAPRGSRPVRVAQSSSGSTADVSVDRVFQTALELL
jgi:ADP-heptose:LPS heptosyltransferase